MWEQWVSEVAFVHSGALKAQALVYCGRAWVVLGSRCAMAVEDVGHLA